MWDVLNLRSTCRKMQHATRYPFLKSIWNIKRKQLENKFIENRSNIIRAWMKAKPKIDKNKKLVLREETDDLFETLKENLTISRDLKWINGNYNQKELEKYGFKQKTFTNLVKIHGRGTWTISGENAPEGLLITPRCLGDGYYCETKEKWVCVLICECTWFLWENGVVDSLRCIEEEHFRESRYLPLYGETFDRCLDKINLAAFQWTTFGQDNQEMNVWPHEFRQMYVPRIGCFHRPSSTDKTTVGVCNVQPTKDG